jgi:hypothetical protein
MGWTLGCYGLLLMGAILLWGGNFPRSVPALSIAGALGLLLLWCFEEPNALTVLLSLLGLASLGLLARDGWSASALVWAKRWAAFATAGWIGIFKDSILYVQTGSAQGNEGKPRFQFLRNWFLPVILSLVFLALFAAANPIISDWLDRAIKRIESLFENLPTLGRVVMWALVAIWVWALLRFRSRINNSRKETILDSAAVFDGFLTPGVIMRCLLIFNALFAVQTALDIFYLWGGAHLPKGMTYAQYAHRGAYPLLATALLAAVFVLVSFRAGSQAGRMVWARRLVSAWLGQNVFLVISAGWRLCLYINIYTLTRWRIAAAIWMFLVVCGLVWILVRIVTGRSNLWLVNVNALTTLVVLYACSFVNFDGLIAGFNVRHCKEIRGEGVPIDLAYLESLGPDTLPALIWLARELKDPVKSRKVHNVILNLRVELRQELGNWRGWTFRRHRLALLDLPKEARWRTAMQQAP